MRHWNNYVLCGMVLAGLMLLGCSGATDGPQRYEVSGSATYKGEPIPFGRILLEPDATQGNTGPGSVAEIKNGWYVTRPNSGHTGGSFRVTIMGTDGSRPASADVDNSLFPPYQTSIVLPEQSSQHDFDVPLQ
ncbi:hypothetical protein [Bremerella alba]|uniref:Lipoprotein n=1 Tax=Bremerella alba TaxID=980252 RepID=A0A7V9A6B9_9BACT|nr:hypothetical protein [Bremerella alba]MBA2113781.1 hypothetical protein [Bremerella alba]